MTKIKNLSVGETNIVTKACGCIASASTAFPPSPSNYDGNPVVPFCRPPGAYGAFRFFFNCVVIAAKKP